MYQRLLRGPHVQAPAKQGQHIPGPQTLGVARMPAAGHLRPPVAVTAASLLLFGLGCG